MVNHNNSIIQNNTPSSTVTKRIGFVDEVSDRYNAFLETSEKGNLATGSVRLLRRKSSTKQSVENTSSDENNNTSYVSDKEILHGFVAGNFSSGKVFDLIVNRCYVMAYQCDTCDCKPVTSQPSLLAVGTVNGLLFYETSSYVLVHETQRQAMVSAIQWIPITSSSTWYITNCYVTNNQPSLLAVGDLDGNVSLYLVDVNILESQGPTLLYEFNVKDQVRAMACAYIGSTMDSNNNKTLLISIGDKSGAVTFCSLRIHQSTLLVSHIDTVVEKHYSSAVLGMSISTHTNLLATSTKGGEVFVYTLTQQHETGIIYIQKSIWYTERHGPVRCVLFSGDETQLCFGGYDKTVVFIETKSWVLSRQLQLHGTVR